MIGETVKRGACRADSASEPWKLNETGKRGAGQAGSARGPSKKDNTKHAKRQCSRQEFNTSMRSKCAVHIARRAAVLEAQGQHKARHAAVLGPWMSDEAGKRGAGRADSTSGPWKLNETGKRGACQVGSASGPSKRSDTKHAVRQCSSQESATCTVKRGSEARVQQTAPARGASQAGSASGPWMRAMVWQAVLRKNTVCMRSRR